jgi:elongation factor G
VSLNERDTSKVVDAHTPLSTLFGDVPGLRGISCGRTNATMHFGHYAAVPPAITQQIAT